MIKPTWESCLNRWRHHHRSHDSNNCNQWNNHNHRIIRTAWIYWLDIVYTSIIQTLTIPSINQSNPLSNCWIRKMLINETLVRSLNISTKSKKNQTQNQPTWLILFVIVTKISATQCREEEKKAHTHPPLDS